jgi:hypothetical protein
VCAVVLQVGALDEQSAFVLHVVRQVLELAHT